MPLLATAHEIFNFNSGWEIDRSALGIEERETVTLPHAWNEADAFKVEIGKMQTGVVWYRKTFSLPASAAGKRVVVEFEGARQAADVYVNGTLVGYNENGVMAFGFDITDLLQEGENLIEVKTDNTWNYKDRTRNMYYQWNSSKFYANYGGLNKDVRLHLLPKIHQTLPLFSNLGTTGIYVYGTDYDVSTGTCTICVESQVQNDNDEATTETMTVVVEDMDGQEVARFESAATEIAAGGLTVLKAQKTVSGLHLWSWGYGYLYRVKTTVAGDVVTTTTGFRKTEFKDGTIYLNDRAIMVHGFAQRSTNEWPGVGSCVPAWVSDLSNDLFVKAGGNLVRWMHVTPSRQDIMSCDRVGLLQAMPAGDEEHDIDGARWEHRKELMRDAIIYNRNSPSIIFYECGNKEISADHQSEMLAIRDEYDPDGGRAMGCRDMLDSDVAEYGGTMLNINKSKTKPVWMMEYCRDEQVRLYWNSWSYPYHHQGYDQLYYNYEVSGTKEQFDHIVTAGTTVNAKTAYLHVPVNRGTEGHLRMVFTDSNDDPTAYDELVYNFLDGSVWNGQTVADGTLHTYDTNGQSANEGVSFLFAEGGLILTAGTGLKFNSQVSSTSNYVRVSVPAGWACDITAQSAGNNRRINASFTLGDDNDQTACKFNDGTTSTKTLTNTGNATAFVYIYQPKNNPNSVLKTIRIYQPLPTEIVRTVRLSVGSAGKATYCGSQALDFTNATQLAAYKATVDEENKVVLMTKVTHVAAGEGIVLRSVNGSSATEDITIIDEAESLENNALVGLLTSRNIAQVSGDYTNFYLNAQGFIRVQAAGITLGAGKAYLQVPTSILSADARLTVLFPEEQTPAGISDVSSSRHSTLLYDIQGRNVNRGNATKGLYILDGKKVVFQ